MFETKLCFPFLTATFPHSLSLLTLPEFELPSCRRMNFKIVIVFLLLLLVCVELIWSPPPLTGPIVEASSPASLISAGSVVYVRGQVFRQIVSPGEAFSTRFAMIRPLPCMNTQVARQIRLSPKSSSAKQAHKRPFTRVLSYMQLQVLL